MASQRHVARLVDAGRDEHRVVLRAQFAHRDVAADLDIQVKDDAAGLVLPPAPQHDLLLQLEVRDAVHHQPANAIVAVIHMHLVTAHPQPLGGRKPGRAGTDDAHAQPQFHPRRRRLDPTILPGGVDDIALDRADGDALEAFLDDAITLAQPVLRADAAADFREGVGGGGDLVSFLHPAFCGQLQPVGNVVLQRAVHLAEGHTALAAPAGLSACIGRLEAIVDFLEVDTTLVGLTLWRRPLLQSHELQHFLDHCARLQLERAGNSAGSHWKGTNPSLGQHE